MMRFFVWKGGLCAGTLRRRIVPRDWVFVKRSCAILRVSGSECQRSDPPGDLRRLIGFHCGADHQLLVDATHGVDQGEVQRGPGGRHPPQPRQRRPRSGQELVRHRLAPARELQVQRATEPEMALPPEADAPHAVVRAPAGVHHGEVEVDGRALECRPPAGEVGLRAGESQTAVSPQDQVKQGVSPERDEEGRTARRRLRSPAAALNRVKLGYAASRRRRTRAGGVGGIRPK